MLCIKQNILVSRKKESKWHSSTILEIDDSEILVSLPRINGEPLELDGDETVEITFTVEGIRYLFESVITQKFGGALVIESPRLLEKVELRRYPRIPVEFELTYSDMSCGNGTVQLKKGYTLDISGNGVRFSVDQMYNPGTYMSISFNLPVEEKLVTLNAQCRIVRIVIDHQKENLEYQLGAEFSRLAEKDQDTIINFVINRLTKVENSPEG